MPDSPVADFELDAYLLSQELVVAVGAFIVCAVSLIVVSRPVLWAVAGLAGIAAGLAVGWLLIRRRRFRLYDGLVIASHPPQRSRRIASRVGAVRGLIVLAVLFVVVVAENYVLDLDAFRYAGPLLVALTGALEYSRRGLDAWQSEHQRLVCTRVGFRTFAWTRAGARAALVAAPASIGTA